MDKKLRNYIIFSLVFEFILGTLLHFTYNLSGNSLFVASFSAINESTWEHLKLVFFPMLITTIIGLIYLGKTRPNILCARTFGMVTSMFFMVTFFYTYSGVVGNNYAIIDIISFFVSVSLGEYVSYKILTSYFKCKDKASITVLIVLLVSFILFTYITPELGIFKDPVTGEYGMTLLKY